MKKIQPVVNLFLVFLLWLDVTDISAVVVFLAVTVYFL